MTVFSKTITVSQPQTVTVRKSTRKILTVSQPQLVTLRRTIGKIIRFTQAQLVKRGRSFTKTITFVQTQAFDFLVEKRTPTPRPSRKFVILDKIVIWKR